MPAHFSDLCCGQVTHVLRGQAARQRHPQLDRHIRQNPLKNGYPSLPRATNGETAPHRKASPSTSSSVITSFSGPWHEAGRRQGASPACSTRYGETRLLRPHRCRSRRSIRGVPAAAQNRRPMDRQPWAVGPRAAGIDRPGRPATARSTGSIRGRPCNGICEMFPNTSQGCALIINIPVGISTYER